MGSFKEGVKRFFTVFAYVAAVVTIMGVAYQFFGERLRAPKHRFEVAVMPEVILLEPDELISDSLEVYWGAKRVRTLSAQTFLFKNTGREAIRKLDFEEQPQIIFSKGVEIIRIIDKRDPDNLAAEFRACDILKNVLVVTFGLFNPGDTYEVTTILSGDQVEEPRIEARIANIPEIKIYEYAKKQEKSLFPRWFLMATVIYLIVYSFTYWFWFLPWMRRRRLRRESLDES